MKEKNKVWFVNKTYGYGWTPATLEGWLVLLSYIVFNFFNFFRIHMYTNPTDESIATFLVETFFATMILLFICYNKGEKLEWRWGKKK